MAQNEYPMHIAMVGVVVNDPSAAFKHYTEVLGFEEVMHDPDNMLAIVKSASAEDGPMLILEPNLNDISKDFQKRLYEAGIPAMSFGAADIEKTVAELKAKGVEFKKEVTEQSWGTDAIFDDGQGNFIQLLEMK